MKDKKTGKSIGINTKMSPLDIEKLNIMYPCKSKKSCGKFMRLLYYRFKVILTFIDFVRSDSVSTKTMQDEINVLKTKRDDLKEKLAIMCPCQPTGPVCGKFQLDELT